MQYTSVKNRQLDHLFYLMVFIYYLLGFFTEYMAASA